MNQRIKSTQRPQDEPAVADLQLPMLSERQWAGLAKLGDALADEQAPSAEELLQAWQVTVSATRVLSEVTRFAERHLAKELTGSLVEATALFERHEPVAALGELMVTLDHLRRNGSLARLRIVSDSLNDLGEGVSIDTLVAAWIERAETTPLSRFSVLTEAADAAVESGMHESTGEGGLIGLLRTLRDPAVQRALKVLASGTERLGGRHASPNAADDSD
jgi:uncharacterized protein YjgD (DUF1641 family)